MASITVVIPFYNGKEHIGRAVKSALAQTHHVSEIIIVDDASPHPVEAGDFPADDRIRIVRLQSNAGGGAARNRGIAEAKSDYVALLDCDDEWMADKLRQQVALLPEYPIQSNVLILCGVIVRENNREIMRTRLVSEIISPLEAVLIDGAFLQTSTYLMRRDLAAKIGFDPTLRKHQDWDFLNRWYQAGYQFGYVDEPLSVYYRGGSSQVSRSRNMQQSQEWIENRKSDISQKAAARFYLSEIYPLEVSVRPITAFRTLLGHVNAGHVKLLEALRMTRYALRITAQAKWARR